MDAHSLYLAKREFHPLNNWIMYLFLGQFLNILGLFSLFIPYT